MWRLRARYRYRVARGSWKRCRRCAGCRPGGVTTVRDAWGADAGLTRALREGWITGPDLLLSLRQLSPTGGLGDAWRPDTGCADALSDPALPDPVFDGPDAARAAVRRMVRAGADWIKLGAGGFLHAVKAGVDVSPTEAVVAGLGHGLDGGPAGLELPPEKAAVVLAQPPRIGTDDLEVHDGQTHAVSLPHRRSAPPQHPSEPTQRSRHRIRAIERCAIRGG